MRILQMLVTGIRTQVELRATIQLIHRNLLESCRSGALAAMSDDNRLIGCSQRAIALDRGAGAAPTTERLQL